MKPSVGRAALLGLGLGLVGGALFLVVMVFRTDAVDCTALTGDECQLQMETASELTRYQAAIAGALACGAAAIFLVLNSREGREKPVKPPTPSSG